MKPTTTLEIVLAVIQLVVELLKRKEKKVEKDIPLANPFRDDHTDVLNGFLGRDKNK